MKHFEPPSFYFRRVLPGKKIVLLFCTKYVVPSQIRPTIVKLNIRNAKAPLTSSLFVFAAQKRTIIVSFWWDRSVLTAARTAGATAVRKAVSASLMFFSCLN